MIDNPELKQAEDALASLEDVILTKMWEGSHTSDWGPTGMAFNLRAFDPLPREVVRGVLRNLRDKGMAQHVRGLWDEGGEPRGAGYALTEKAAQEMQRMENARNELMALVNSEALVGGGYNG